MALQGRDDAALLDEAAAAVEQVLKKLETWIRIDNLRIDAFLWQAETARRLAIARPSEARAQVPRGIAGCDKGLAVNPNHARLLVMLGRLRLLEAGATSGKTQADWAQKSLDAFNKGKTINSLFAKEVEPLVAEAERMRGGR